ncbi:MAG: hypothetical protein ACOYZ7_03500 [Chloroflexota bacterium]
MSTSLATTSDGAVYPQNGAYAATAGHVYTFDAVSSFGGSSAVTDWAGNLSTVSFTVVRDVASPTVTITAPARVTTPTIPVTWTASDALSGVAGYDVQVRVDPATLRQAQGSGQGGE